MTYCGEAPRHPTWSYQDQQNWSLIPVQSFHYPAAMDASSVIELRQYALQPGRREDLIALFEDEFIEPQRAAGIRLLGQFRDVDAADGFVWLRGFRDMPARAEALRSFYGGYDARESGGKSWNPRWRGASHRRRRSCG